MTRPIHPYLGLRFGTFPIGDTPVAADEVLLSEDVPTDAAVLIEELEEKFGWTSQYQEALSQPELTPEERRALVASMALALVVWFYAMGLQYPQVGNAIQLADSLVGFWCLLQITGPPE